MALPSDEQGADSRLQVRFYKRAVKQDQESLDAGRPIYKEFDFVHICVAGDTLTEIDTYVSGASMASGDYGWFSGASV
jgi:hypothetical protein